MARAFFQPGAFFKPGAFFEEAAAPATPAVIRLGDPGAALYQLCYRAQGGSTVDLDLLYGLLSDPTNSRDIQPIFAIATRSGAIRTWSAEVPRQAIRDACVENFATLLEVNDVVIESSPVGANLFGSVGLTTSPHSSVIIDDTNGDFKRLLLAELVLFSPAGLFVDIGHAVVAPVMTGVVTDITSDGAQVQISYGFSARRQHAPRVTD